MQISIGNAGLSAIYAANLAVTLARQFAQVVDAASQTIVAWQAFAPLQQNAVTWDDHFYCFATTTPLALGQVIAMNARSELPMQIGVVYEFAQGQFGYGQKAQNAAAYVIANNTPGTIYGFGLAQSAVVNNVTNACAVLRRPRSVQSGDLFHPG